MSPAEFIPLAENEGMIAQVTDYVIEEVLPILASFWHGSRICTWRLTFPLPISILRA